MIREKIPTTSARYHHGADSMREEIEEEEYSIARLEAKKIRAEEISEKNQKRGKYHSASYYKGKADVIKRHLRERRQAR